MAHPENQMVYDENWNQIQSRDKYRKIEDARGIEHEDDGYYGRQTVLVNLTLYLHEPTGLVVHDVAAFEKWLGGRA